MAIRYKTFSAGERLFAADLNQVSANGVVQIDTVAELATVFTDLPEVNVVYCLEDNMTYGRTAIDFHPLIVQKETIELSNDGEGAATTSKERFDYNGSTYDTYTFNGADTFTVKEPGATVDLVVVSGGAGGGSQTGPHGAGGGGAGGTRWVLNQELLPGEYSVVIGAGRANGWGRSNGQNEGGRSSLTNTTTATTIWNPRGGGEGGHTYNTNGQNERWGGLPGGNGGGGSDGGGKGSGTPGEGQNGATFVGGGSGPTYGQGGQGTGITLTGYYSAGDKYLAWSNGRNNQTGPANTGAGGSAAIGSGAAVRGGGSGVVIMRKFIK